MWRKLFGGARRRRALEGLDEDMRDHLEHEDRGERRARHVARGSATSGATRVWQPRTRAGRHARRLDVGLARSGASGCALRAPHAPQESRLCGCSRADALARDRREHGDLHAHQRVDAALAAGAEGRAIAPGLDDAGRIARVHSQRFVVVPGCSCACRSARRLRGGRRIQHVHLRRRSARERPANARCLRDGCVLRDDGYRPGRRPSADTRGRPDRRAARGRHHRRLLGASVRTRPANHRTTVPRQRPFGHHRRRQPARLHGSSCRVGGRYHAAGIRRGADSDPSSRACSEPGNIWLRVLARPRAGLSRSQAEAASGVRGRDCRRWRSRQHSPRSEELVLRTPDSLFARGRLAGPLFATSSDGRCTC